MTKKIITCSLLFAIGIVSVNAQKSFLKKPSCSADIAAQLIPKAIDTTLGRGVANNYNMWDNGQVILVKFMPGGGPGLRNRIIQLANEWTKYANITFKFVDDNAPATNIRIQLGANMGHNSAVGTDANSIPQYMQTMNLDTLFLADIKYYVQQIAKKTPGFNALSYKQKVDLIRKEMGTDPNHWSTSEMYRTVVHEFGHSIGMLHEQSYKGAISWNKSDSVYNYYKQTQGWEKDKVDFNVFNVSDKFYTNGTTYDPKSIMHYTIEPWQTTNGYSLKSGDAMSDGDKLLIAALYPKGKTISDLEVPRINVSNFSNLDVKFDNVRKGFVVKPSFSLTTNSKLGTVYCIALMFDENGSPIPAKSEKDYNVFGYTGTALPLRLLPNSNVSYNKLPKDNFELFLPSSAVPELNGKKVVLQFMIYQIDVNNGERRDKLFFRAAPSSPMSMPR